MEYRLLGRTGLRVAPLALGTLNLGGITGEPESVRLVQAALDGGINLIDTADGYNAGESERVVGRALAEGSRRERVVLATKVAFPVGKAPNERGLSRRHILEACEASLRRLGTDWIDLYQLHRPDPNTPIDETLRALDDLVRAGKVRYCGTTTFPAWQVMEALAVAEREHLPCLVSDQPPYNLLDRRIENELVPLAQRYHLALLPWAPLAQGVLAGRYPVGQAAPSDSRAGRLAGSIYAERVTPRGVAVGEQFAALAHMHGKTPAQLALLWCKDQPGVTAPIVGPRTLEHLHDALPVLNMRLSPAEREACDALNPPGGVLVNFHNTAAWMKTPIT